VRLTSDKPALRSRQGEAQGGQKPATRNQLIATVKITKPDKVNSIPNTSALNTALRILTPRDHSKYELVQKLKQRGFGSEDIEDAISACVRFDYINDIRTTELFIRQLKRKGFGKKRIQLELTKKGLKGDRIQGILDQSVSETDEREGAARILKKNIKRFEREKDRLKRRDKIYRFLHARGFSQRAIAENLKQYDQRDYLQGEPG
jgi:regulatory protein